MKKIWMPQTLVGRVLIFGAILAATGFFCALGLHADIYQWLDENGVTHYSNSPPQQVENFEKMSDEYRYDEAADQERVKADQKAIDELTEESDKEKQKVHVEQQTKIFEEEQKESEAAGENRPHLFTSECFSPSYSVQQGRGAFEAVIPRELMTGEYRNLQALFGSLDGKWAGNAMATACEGSPDSIRKVVDTYSVESEGRMVATASGKQFDLETNFYSMEKRESHQENFRFYLDSKKLALEPDISTSDIELITISPNKLVYVKNTQPRNQSGAFSARETVVAIEKTGNASFLVEKFHYYNGMMVAVDTWHLTNN